MRRAAPLVLALLVAPALAQEAAALRARADERVYSPALAGLRGLRVLFRCPPASTDRIALYWKKDRRVVRFETADGKTAAEQQESLLSDAKTALEVAVPVPFSKREAQPRGGGLVLEPTAGDVVGEPRL